MDKNEKNQIISRSTHWTRKPEVWNGIAGFVLNEPSRLPFRPKRTWEIGAGKEHRHIKIIPFQMDRLSICRQVLHALCCAAGHSKLFA